MSATAQPPVVKARHFSKTFINTTVLEDADLDVRGGEIHALCGHNGSGKSTLIKVLSGYHDPDRGAELEVNGKPVSLPLAANQAVTLGFAFVHQDLGLVDDLSVVDNLRVSKTGERAFAPIHWRSERRKAEKAMSDFGVDCEAEAHVWSLSKSQKAILAIVRALQELPEDEPGLLVLDEPTVNLPPAEVGQLFAAMHEVASRGHGVLFVSHRLEEVIKHSDRVTVLRKGKVIEDREVAGLTEPELAELILGRELSHREFSVKVSRTGEPALSCRGLSGESVEDFSMDIHPGEVLGITGLLGSGFDRVPYLLFGAAEATAGDLRIAGKERRIRRPTQAMDAGLALVPADRLRDNGVGEATLIENLTLTDLDRFGARLGLNRKGERKYTEEILDVYDVYPPRPLMLLRELSGGNQQKLLIAKWLQIKPTVLLLHEPTQGIDIGAREQVFGLIKECAEEGTAVLIASDEYQDLARVCNRVLVFAGGRQSAELSQAELSEDSIADASLLGAGELEEESAAAEPSTANQQLPRQAAGMFRAPVQPGLELLRSH